LTEIAIALEEAPSRRREGGEPGRTGPLVIARGRDCSVADVIRTRGPSDHPYEERHSGCSILRTFERLTGVTSHQCILRARLPTAALQLADGAERMTDVAFDCGFGDSSNSFRGEFGVSPRAFRGCLR
jgi:hypothetical protein